MKDISELQFPLWIVFENGWVEKCGSVEDSTLWNPNTLNEFKSYGVIVDFSGDVWNIKTACSREKMTLLEKVKWILRGYPIVEEFSITVVECEGGLVNFKETLMKCINRSKSKIKECLLEEVSLREDVNSLTSIINKLYNSLM